MDESHAMEKGAFNNGEIESRYKKTKSGWFSRRGTRPGYPASWPTSRVVGVDLNLQVKNEYSRVANQ